jgi:hypothetical protein
MEQNLLYEALDKVLREVRLEVIRRSIDIDIDQLIYEVVID